MPTAAGAPPSRQTLALVSTLLCAVFHSCLGNDLLHLVFKKRQFLDVFPSSLVYRMHVSTQIRVRFQGTVHKGPKTVLGTGDSGQAFTDQPCLEETVPSKKDPVVNMGVGSPDA